LAFNRIEDLSELQSFKKGSHSLAHVELYSNRLTSLQHVVKCLSGCTCLQNLEFRKGTNTNPICGVPAYRANILAQLPWLKVLDGMDKNGNITRDDDNLSDIPGI